MKGCLLWFGVPLTVLFLFTWLFAGFWKAFVLYVFSIVMVVVFALCEIFVSHLLREDDEDD